MRSLPEEGSKFKRINEEFLTFMAIRKENTDIIDLGEDETHFE